VGHQVDLQASIQCTRHLEQKLKRAELPMLKTGNTRLPGARSFCQSTLAEPPLQTQVNQLTNEIELYLQSLMTQCGIQGLSFAGQYTRRKMTWSPMGSSHLSSSSNSATRRRAVSVSRRGVFWVFFLKMCSNTNRRPARAK